MPGENFRLWFMLTEEMLTYQHSLSRRMEGINFSRKIENGKAENDRLQIKTASRNYCCDSQFYCLLAISTPTRIFLSRAYDGTLGLNWLQTILFFIQISSSPPQHNLFTAQKGRVGSAHFAPWDNCCDDGLGSKHEQAWEQACKICRSKKKKHHS